MRTPKLALRFACIFAAAVIGTVPTALRAADRPEPLPGTAPLVLDRPLDVVMVDGINRFAERALADSVGQRAQFWHRDFSSPQAYEKSVAPNRERLRTILGVVDDRVKPDAFELITTTAASSKLATGGSYTVHAVRWRVLPGVTAEGLLLEPDAPPVARVIALPDADWTPEAFAGLSGGVAMVSQLPRRLAECGVEVVVPTLINRDDTWSGNPAIHFTNQPHREFIYRMAFELGRHIIGYEVQKVLAAVDLFEQMNKSDGRGHDLPIGVAGVGEGGLLALYSAALDPRHQIDLGERLLRPARGNLAGADLPQRLVALERVRRRGSCLAGVTAFADDRGGHGPADSRTAPATSGPQRRRPGRDSHCPDRCGEARVRAPLRISSVSISSVILDGQHLRGVAWRLSGTGKLFLWS